jgi:hypothetical protein
VRKMKFGNPCRVPELTPDFLLEACARRQVVVREIIQSRLKVGAGMFTIDRQLFAPPDDMDCMTYGHLFWEQEKRDLTRRPDVEKLSPAEQVALGTSKMEWAD